MNAEQASKLSMRRPTRRDHGEGCKRPGMPRHLANERSTGRLRRGTGDCMYAQGDVCNTGSPVGDAHAPTETHEANLGRQGGGEAGSTGKAW